MLSKMTHDKLHRYDVNQSNAFKGSRLTRSRSSTGEKYFLY